MIRPVAAALPDGGSAAALPAGLGWQLPRPRRSGADAYELGEEPVQLLAKRVTRCLANPVSAVRVTIANRTWYSASSQSLARWLFAKSLTTVLSWGGRSVRERSAAGNSGTALAGMEIMAEFPVDSRSAAAGGDHAGLLGCIGAEQIVQGVPAETMLRD